MQHHRLLQHTFTRIQDSTWALTTFHACLFLPPSPHGPPFSQWSPRRPPLCTPPSWPGRWEERVDGRCGRGLGVEGLTAFLTHAWEEGRGLQRVSSRHRPGPVGGEQVMVGWVLPVGEHCHGCERHQAGGDRQRSVLMTEGFSWQPLGGCCYK